MPRGFSHPKSSPQEPVKARERASGSGPRSALGGSVGNAASPSVKDVKTCQPVSASPQEPVRQRMRR